MSSGTELYDALHIGSHKCASTYLQRVGLASHPEIQLIWRDHKQLFYEFWEYGFGADGRAFIEKIRNTPLSDPKPTAKKKIFSNEGFCGHMFTGENARLIADLTYELFGNIKCFLVIREPYSHVYSVWNQYVQEGGVLGLRDFLFHPTSPTYSRREARSRLWQKATHRNLVQHWAELFGKDRFRVFLLEDLITAPTRFWSELYGFLDVDSTFLPAPDKVRGGYPHKLAILKLAANRFAKTRHNVGGVLPLGVHRKIRRLFNSFASKIPPGKKPDVKLLAPEEVRAEIREANRWMSRFIGRDLSKSGYDL